MPRPGDAIALFALPFGAFMVDAVWGHGRNVVQALLALRCEPDACVRWQVTYSQGIGYSTIRNCLPSRCLTEAAARERSITLPSPTAGGHPESPETYPFEAPGSIHRD